MTKEEALEKIKFTSALSDEQKKWMVDRIKNLDDIGWKFFEDGYLDERDDLNKMEN
jgi:hypothetical protein